MMLEIYFHLLTVVIVLALATATGRIISKSKNNRFLLVYLIGFLSFWLTYIYGISRSPILLTYEMPPRIPLLVVLPVFIVIVVFHLSKRFNFVIEVMPKSWPIYFQSFRIAVELLIYGLYLKGIGPIQATFLGYNYELYFGLSAILIGLTTFVFKLRLPKLILAWNFIGLGMLATIVFIFISGAYFPVFWGETKPMVTLRFMEFPYIMIAALYMPLAVFTHILSLRQWWKED